MSTDAERRCLSHKWESTCAQTPLSPDVGEGRGEGYAELHCPPTSASCAAPRIRRSWSRARRNWATRRSRSPTNARWPASCAPTWRRRNVSCKLIVGSEIRLGDGRASCCWRRTARLRQPVRADHAGAPQRHQGALHAYAGRSRRGRARLPRLAACRLRFRRLRTRRRSPHCFPGRAWLRWNCSRRPTTTDGWPLRSNWPTAAGLPLVAAATCTCTCAERRALQDTLTAIRLACRSAERGRRAASQRRAPSAHARAIWRELYPPQLAGRDAGASPRAARFRSTSCVTSIRDELVPPGETADHAICAS